MNFLSHALLSGENKKVILGGIIADSIKGKVIELYDKEVKWGIKLHRLIDNFTDNNEIFKKSVSRLEPKFKRYSSVVADIYYDHFLSANFHLYSSLSLNSFVELLYKVLIENYDILPQRNKKILPFMVTQNWLVGYSSFEELQRVFDGMTTRTAFSSDMQQAVSHLKKNYYSYLNEFSSFFPEIQKYAKYQSKFYFNDL